MKKIICITIAALLFNGCFHLAMDKCVDLRFYNNSDVDISVSSTLTGDYSSFLVKDMVIKAHESRLVHGNECDDCLDMSYERYNTDTIFWYVRKAEDNEILQRYDMSLADAKHVYDKDCFAFPPTEAMRNIKMWPPYGTYDEHGNRVTNPDTENPPAAGF